MGPMENVMESLHTMNKGMMLNILENFHIYKEMKMDNQINDKGTVYSILYFTDILLEGIPHNYLSQSRP